MRKIGPRAGWALLLAALALYLALALYQWDRPAPDPDETLDAVPAMQVLLGQPPDCYSTLQLAGRRWPLMVMPYVGCVSTYLLLPAFATLGPGLLALRLTGIALGVASLLLAWGFLREFLDGRVAGLSVLLLAVDPSFVFWTRMNSYVALPMLPLSLAALWSLYRWYRRRRPGYLVLAAFCLGLGLSTKILFAWYWVALAAGWLVLSPGLQPGKGWRAWLWPLRRAGAPVWGLSAVAGALGSAMLVAHNLPGWDTLRMALGSIRSSRLYGVNNLDILANLRIAAGHDLPVLLNGSWFRNHLHAVYADPLAVPALILALLVLAGLALARRLPFSGKRVALLVVLMAAIVFQSAFTITGFGAHHLVIVWPVPQALVAIALCGVAGLLGSRWRPWPALLIVAVAALLMGGKGWTTWRYHSALARRGGGLGSDPIYALARDLERPGTPPVVALDWGFRRPLQLFTRGAVNPEEGYDFGPWPGQAAEAFIDRRVTESPALYLFHAPECTHFPGHWELFEDVAYRHRLTPVLRQSYSEANGKPAFLVYGLEPTPRLFEAPEIAHPLDGRLGAGIALLGYDLAGDAAGLRLTLYWKALARQTAGYKVFVHLLDAGGEIRAQHDSAPLDWGYPTTEWEVGEIVADRIRIRAEDSLPAGEYRVVIGMYDEQSGERLPITQAGTPAPDGRLELARISVP